MNGKHGKMLGKDEIIKNLLLLDEEISLAFDNDVYYNVVIVGGSALILIDKASRATMDIDAIQCSAELKPYMERYNINDMVLSYRNNFPDDYSDRCVKLDIKTKKINFYTASLEDIVISKLSSVREKDRQDIRDPKVVEAIDWDILDAIVESDDFKNSMLNEHSYRMFMFDYRDYKEEVGK